MIVLSLDSGIERTGYAIVENTGIKPKVIQCGCIFTDKTMQSAYRIATLVDSLETIIDRYKPAVIVIEQLFFNINKKTVIGVAQAQGATMYMASKKNCRVEFLTPLQIKETLTGYGRADKKQIEKMLKLVLHSTELPKPDDATDALACALAFCTLDNFNSKIENL